MYLAQGLPPGRLPPLRPALRMPPPGVLCPLASFLAQLPATCHRASKRMYADLQAPHHPHPSHPISPPTRARTPPATPPGAAHHHQTLTHAHPTLPVTAAAVRWRWTSQKRWRTFTASCRWAGVCLHGALPAACAAALQQPMLRCQHTAAATARASRAASACMRGTPRFARCAPPFTARSPPWPAGAAH